MIHEDYHDHVSILVPTIGSFLARTRKRWFSRRTKVTVLLPVAWASLSETDKVMLSHAAAKSVKDAYWHASEVSGS